MGSNDIVPFDSEFDPADLTVGTLKSLYRLILKIRKVELKIEALYCQNEMKTPIHLCIGQEGVAAGVCSNLHVDDYVFSNHRGHGHYIAKGGDLKAMIAELYCRRSGCSKGKGGSMHLVDTAVGLLGSSSIVGGGIPIATGAALGSALRGDKRVAVVFFGDAAVEEGVLYESLNFASLKKLPVVYVCENNFYSVCSPLSNRQANDDLYRRPKGFSVPGYRVDGNNVLDVYRISKKAVADARAGNGPSFLECRTYRYRGHSGTEDGVKSESRSRKELDEWLARCPLRTYERFLRERSILTREEMDADNDAIEEEIRGAFEFARNSPLPDKTEIMDDLFHQGK